MYNTDILERGFKEFNIPFSTDTIDQFLKYYELLMQWNNKINLTSITDFEDVLIKHFIDSLSLVRIIPGLSEEKVLDLGSGAGFPGIPLKIVFPGINITLADSVNKKLLFINDVIEKLGLENAETVHGRAEDLARDVKYRGRYDICVSRAVANLSTLSEYCLPFVKTGGAFISYKSSESTDEIKSAEKAISLLGGKIENDIIFELPYTDIKRRLILIRKDKATLGAYPRKAGTPLKNPL